jgi:hypothetical protein
LANNQLQPQYISQNLSDAKPVYVSTYYKYQVLNFGSFANANWLIISVYSAYSKRETGFHSFRHLSTHRGLEHYSLPFQTFKAFCQTGQWVQKSSATMDSADEIICHRLSTKETQGNAR